MTTTTRNGTAPALPEFDRPPADPLALVRQWFDRARESNVADPGAMSLATADTRGRASNRIVQVLDLSAEGVVFSSHSGSQKGRELAETGWGSGVLYWRETQQQVVLAGPVSMLPTDRSDALWEARSPATHPMSVASRQSDTLYDEEGLRARARRLADTGERLPRPEAFVGYLLRPVAVEFWKASPDRLHRRLRYDQVDGGWASRRLQP